MDNERHALDNKQYNEIEHRALLEKLSKETLTDMIIDMTKEIRELNK